ncbi:hypothetical protein CTM96_16775 [Photobacterium phosphoreum]|uniref:Uncharacterized protein n=1 Tax=Photobacterium phosphoreum TaxID=659 RepID=A0ABX5FZX5_PHOPO|nr:hypothetical protein CTM96_16775 [Photobacterium phosphoreum]
MVTFFDLSPIFFINKHHSYQNGDYFLLFVAGGTSDAGLMLFLTEDNVANNRNRYSSIIYG